VTQHRDGSLPEAVAKQILARAAQLDATERMSVSVGDLRTAAVEAGISAGALDRALSEITSVPDSTATRARGRKSRRLMVALAAAVVIIGFWTFVGRRVVVEEPAAEPIPEVLPPR
jgi:hypothetical protein